MQQIAIFKLPRRASKDDNQPCLLDILFESATGRGQWLHSSAIVHLTVTNASNRSHIYIYMSPGSNPTDEAWLPLPAIINHCCQQINKTWAACKLHSGWLNARSQAVMTWHRPGWTSIYTRSRGIASPSTASQVPASLYCIMILSAKVC